MVLNDFFEEGESSQDEMDRQYKKTNKQIADLEFLQMLSAPEDKFNAVLKINPGAGGTESQDWAEMLMRYAALVRGNVHHVHSLWRTQQF